VKVCLLALASIVAGGAAGLVCVWWEFSGVPEQFEPDNQPAGTSTASVGTGALPQPRAVVVGGPEYDFGTGQRDGKLSHEFVIENRGQGPLTLSKGTTSCRCTVSDLAHDRVPPGASAKVKLEWKMNTTGRRFRQTAEIFTNDPKLPTIVLVVQGKLIDAVRLDPAEVVFSRITASDGGQAEFRVFGYKAPHLEVVKHEFTNQESAPYLELEFRPLDKAVVSAEPDAKCGLLGVLTAKPGLPMGTINQTIHLTTDVEGVGSLDLSVTGSVTSDISVLGPHTFDESHNVLRLGSVSASEGVTTQLRLLVKGPHRRDVRLAVKEVDPAEVLAATLGAATEINNGAVFLYPLTIAVRKDARPLERLGGDAGKLGKIVIETTHPAAKSINLHVRFAVK
jgi:hypothetical protein